MINKAFIVPDVHGRAFWIKAKEALSDETIDKIVFLGDYFDPYDDEEEYISDEKLIDSFNQIVQMKKENPEKIVLLLGNHDIHYLYKNQYCSRHDGENESRNCELIKSNLDCFDLMYIDDISCNDYNKVLFTHAGLTSGTLKTFGRAEYPKDDIVALCDAVNKNIKDVKTHEYHVLSELLLRVSRYRGGSFQYGSIVWADIREVVPNTFDFDDVFQIFGHTRSFFPTVMKRYAMLDTQECYIADFAEGIILNTNTGKEFIIR